MSVTQRDFDIMRLEAKEKVRKLYEEWLKAYLGKRVNQEPQKEKTNANLY